MSKNHSVFLEQMTSLGVESAIERGAPLFLPVGTLEAHGRHLPVGTDTLAATGFARKLAERCRGVVAPPLAYGLTNLLVQTAPASHFPEDRWGDMVEATLRCLIGHGFTTVIVINGHGGNRDALKTVARRIVRSTPVALAVIHWWLLSAGPSRAVYGAAGGHAAVEETAAMLAFHSDLVDTEAYHPDQDDFTPEEGIWCYPPPGEVLLYEPDVKARPDFDHDRAGRFISQVVSEIDLRLKRWLSKRHRLAGGLRPRRNPSSETGPVGTT